MKKFFIGLILSVFLILSSVLGVLFFRPLLIINPKNLAFVLHHVKVLKSWSWKEAAFTHEWKAWNKRIFSGHFSNFCLVYTSESFATDTCLQELSWNLAISFTIRDGIAVKTISPLFIRSKETLLTVHDSKKEEKPSSPPDIYQYWKLFWSDLVPDMDFVFKNIVQRDKTFDVKLLKAPKLLTVSSFGFELKADPSGFIFTPPRRYPLPKKLPLAKDPVEFIDLKLTGKVKKEGVPMELSGKLESIDIFVTSFVGFPLSRHLIHDVLLKTKGKFSLDDVKKNMRIYGPKPYTELPAPFNVMNGSIITDFSFTRGKNLKSVVASAVTGIDLKSEKQSLIFSIMTNVPLNLDTYKPRAIDVGIHLEDVKIQLPRLSKKSPPPQFVPDSRFKKTIGPETEKKKGPFPVELKVTANEGTPLKIKTDLLDEDLRLNFNLHLKDGKMGDGFLHILPLKTTVFKRPIRVESATITFHPNVDPLIDATIKFPLPEYKITLKLEGPLDRPRYAFESDPPLPQNDIYAVLLFGRPLDELGTEDKTAANKTNQLLSQGILSLSVLYFLSGSPVEYVGYDPDSKNATAQFGLGKKSSLRVGGGQEGINSTGIRRSLGKGWYLDTSVQNNSSSSGSDPSQARNYGVLLERIISY